MKLYLASYFQPHFHGPGRMIAISSRKPDDFKIDSAFRQFVHDQLVLDHYYELRDKDKDKAAKFFVDSFELQLEEFFAEVENESRKTKTPIKDLLPFEEGDTLLSMERFEYTSYRPTVAKILEKLGYEVVLH